MRCFEAKLSTLEGPQEEVKRGPRAGHSQASAPELTPPALGSDPDRQLVREEEDPSTRTTTTKISKSYIQPRN